MESEQDRKLRGGFYTPEPIADFLADWAVQDSTTSVLEPSCGDGNIIASLINRCEELEDTKQKVTGIEFNPQEAVKAEERGEKIRDTTELEIINEDFFKYCINQTRWKQSEFDAVVGNPPFIRYQDFPEEQRERALEILSGSGLSKTRQMNAWMPFLIGGTQLLSDDGRLAMIVPAALLQVKYAGELREFLIEQFSHLTIITFTELVFDDVLEEVVLVLGERNGNKAAGMNLIELDNVDDLEEYTHKSFEESEVKDVKHSTEKWTLYFLEQDHIDLVRELPDREGIAPVDDYADVNVGVVTGRNAFFLQSQIEEETRGLSDYTRPIVTRSAHLGDGVRFTRDVYQNNISEDRPTRLLDIPETEYNDLPQAVRAYIRLGEWHDYHTGYKTSLRDYWYTVPSTWIPSGFLLRQIHKYPKFVYNETDATCTDTIHRVNYHGPEEDARNFFAATHNSLTWAFSEFIGRSYGGGILELEPNEAEELPIPTKNWDEIDLERVDNLLRSSGPEAVLEYTDDILLKQGIGLSDEEIQELRDIWKILQERRLNRSH